LTCIRDIVNEPGDRDHPMRMAEVRSTSITIRSEAKDGVLCWRDGGVCWTARSPGRDMVEQPKT